MQIVCIKGSLKAPFRPRFGQHGAVVVGLSASCLPLSVAAKFAVYSGSSNSLTPFDDSQVPLSPAKGRLSLENSPLTFQGKAQRSSLDGSLCLPLRAVAETYSGSEVPYRGGVVSAKTLVQKKDRID